MQTVYKLNEIEKVAQEFLYFLRNFSHNSKSLIVGLKGDLGAGKTTLMQHVGKILGIKENIVSPTFVLRRDYVLDLQGFKIQNTDQAIELSWKKLIHIDAYRLEKPEHIWQVLDKNEVEDNENLIIIEWPEKSENIFNLIFEIKHIDAETRSINML